MKTIQIIKKGTAGPAALIFMLTQFLPVPVFAESVPGALKAPAQENQKTISLMRQASASYQTPTSTKTDWGTSTGFLGGTGSLAKPEPEVKKPETPKTPEASPTSKPKEEIERKVERPVYIEPKPESEIERVIPRVKITEEKNPEFPKSEIVSIQRSQYEDGRRAVTITYRDRVNQQMIVEHSETYRDVLLNNTRIVYQGLDSDVSNLKMVQSVSQVYFDEFWEDVQLGQTVFVRNNKGDHGISEAIIFDHQKNQTQKVTPSKEGLRVETYEGIDIDISKLMLLSRQWIKDGAFLRRAPGKPEIVKPIAEALGINPKNILALKVISAERIKPEQVCHVTECVYLVERMFIEVTIMVKGVQKAITGVLVKEFRYSKPSRVSFTPEGPITKLPIR